MLRLCALAVVLMLLGACATSPSGTGDNTICEASGNTIRVVGATNGAMLACMEKFQNYGRVEITSAGGSVRSAIAIGKKLATMQVELTVVDYCESSCANYLVPVARTLVVRSGARIVLHGSVDEWAVARGAPINLYETQRVFAEAHSIPPGWLLMRTETDALNRRHGSSIVFVDGSDSTGDAMFIIVEPEFLASCLPKLAAIWEAPTYINTTRSSPRLTRSLQDQGFRSSGAMRCSGSP